MNNIIEECIKNNSHYCHAIEVNCKHELINCIDNICEVFLNYHNRKTVFEFINTLSIYSLNDKNDEEIYNFDIYRYLHNNY